MKYHIMYDVHIHALCYFVANAAAMSTARRHTRISRQQQSKQKKETVEGNQNNNGAAQKTIILLLNLCASIREALGISTKGSGWGFCEY